MGARFIIQSPKFSCEYVINSLNSFLEKQLEEVNKITEEDFKVQVQAVSVRLSEKDYNLSKENSRFFTNEIATHKYLFDRQEKECAVLNEITRDEFVNHYKKIFFSENTKRLDVQINSKLHEEA